MNDMSPVITPKSDQLNSDSLIAGPITVKIRSVEIRPNTDQPISVFYEGDEGNPWKPCKSMARVMVAVWGADSKNYIGRSLTLYRDPTVKWGGVEVGGIRISHMTDMPSPMTLALTATKGSRKPYTVHPLQMGKVTSAQLTLETAKDALNNTKDMDELQAVWKNKAMAPFRDALGDLLAERKAALSPSPQPSTSDSSPPVDETAAAGRTDADGQDVEASASTPKFTPPTLFQQLCDRLDMADDMATVDSVQAEFDARETEIDFADQPALLDAITAAKERIEGEV